MKVLAFRCSSANSPTRLLDCSEAGYLRAVETAFKRISRGKLLGFFAATAEEVALEAIAVEPVSSPGRPPSSADGDHRSST